MSDESNVGRPPKRKRPAPSTANAAARASSKHADSSPSLGERLAAIQQRSDALVADTASRIDELTALREARKLPEHTIALNFMGAYTITPGMLRSIEEQFRLASPGSQPSVTATFAGDYTISFSGGVEEFLQSPTVETRQLQKFAMSLYERDRPPLQTIRFYLDSEAWASAPGRLDVSARDRALVTDIERIVTDEMAAKKQPYGFLYRWPTFLIVPLVAGLVPGLLLPKSAAAAAFLAGPVIMVSLWALRLALFRRLEFTIGRSGTLADRRRSWRTFAFVTVGLALVLGVASEIGASAVSQRLWGSEEIVSSGDNSQ